jgi:prolyl 4-hydroxylase
MKFQEKDLTHCPEKCQMCMNYDRLEVGNISEYVAYLESKTSFNDNNNQTCSSSGYDGNCYYDEEEYHHNQKQLYYDDEGNIITIMPWQMQHFYEYAHCALDYRKVPNIWKTGDNDNMYERIIRDFPEYSPRVLSRPADSVYAREVKDHNTSVGVGPWLIQLENFLTDEECDEMISQTKTAIEDKEGKGYSLLADDEYGDEQGGACQSTQAWCDPDDCLQEPVLKRAWKKMEELVDLPFDTHTENVHFIQYVPGQKYGRHTDAIPNEYKSLYGPRLFTLLFYLNDIADGNGGQTCFPLIERSDGRVDDPICIQPRRGRAVIWPNIKNEIPEGGEGIPEDLTWHEAHGIQEGYKFAGTVWYHLRNYSYADEIDCTGIYTGTFEEEYYTLYDDFGTDDDDDDSYGEYDDDSYGEYDPNDYGSYDNYGQKYHTGDNNGYEGNIHFDDLVSNAKYFKNPGDYFDDYIEEEEEDELPMAEWW